jgi:DNA-binding beta-propeller fold protein YncE
MKIRVILRAATPVACVVLCCSPACAQSLLVVNQGDATVSIVDPARNVQVARLHEPVSGVHAHEIAVTPDGRTAFVPVYGSVGVGRPGIDGHEMLVVDVPSRKVVGDIGFGHGVRPHQPVYDAAHHVLYVTTELDRSVTIVDPRTRKIVGSIPTGQDQSHMFVLSHDGRRGYTANVGPGTVSVLDIGGRKTIDVIHVSPAVQRISISNDDKRVFTSDVTSPRLAVIDTATNKVANWVDLPGAGYGTAATPDGKWLLVCVPSTEEVAVVDLASLKVVRRVKVPSKPQEVLIRPDGKVAYVSCNSSGKVAVLDLASWTVPQIIAAGPGADGLAWAK